ncbi:unnamed protein product [Penicillium nalgiovense]|nr:unnamed protein product [Penicillium nalgiovense]
MHISASASASHHLHQTINPTANPTQRTPNKPNSNAPRGSRKAPLRCPRSRPPRIPLLRRALYSPNTKPGCATTQTPHQPPSKRIDLPDEQAEVLSCVLEYLYKGDYYPRLRHNSRTQAWELEDADAGVGADTSGELGQATATVFHHRARGVILRDTAIYCAAEKYNLPHLQRLALRKQGLHTGIQCSTILASARFAYANTPDTESKLRAHYLALIVRSRGTFMRSGTMQAEMERGGKMFFDLFVALCNHMVSFQGYFIWVSRDKVLIWFTIRMTILVNRLKVRLLQLIVRVGQDSRVVS